MLSLLAVVILSTGCSIKHPVAKDYNQYLANNEGASVFPKTGLEVDYLIDKETINHRYEFRAAIVGYAHLWIVEFGKILDETLKSKDVQDAFGRLTKSECENSDDGLFISFKLENYEFKNFRTYISLSIVLTNDGNEILNKTYHADGKSQEGKMFWGGAFGMKSAVRVSSADALKKIFNQIRTDLKILLEKKLYDDREDEYYSPQDQQDSKEQKGVIDSFDDEDEYYSPGK